MKKGLSILGSTGSVGCNVLRVVDAFPDRFQVVGLAAGANVERLAEQVARYRPRQCLVSPITPVIAAHAGIGAWGVFYQVEDGTNG